MTGAPPPCRPCTTAAHCIAHTPLPLPSHRDALLADKHLSVQRFSRTLHGPRLQRLIGALGPAKGEAIGAMLDEENSLVAAEEEVPTD